MSDQVKGQDAELDQVRQAMSVRDFAKARDLLEPMLKTRKAGVPAFFMARVEIEEGNLDAARTLLDAFQATRPKHAGAKVQRARILFAEGQLAEARQLAKDALEINPNIAPAERLLERIAAAEIAAEAKAHIDVIEAGYIAARTDGPTEDMRAAAKALAGMEPGPDWNSDPVQAKIAYFHFASDLDWALRNYDAHLVDVSCRFDYVTWPKRIHDMVKDKTVIDVGCGFGGYGMGFLIAGAKSYAGLDPVMKLDSTRAKNKRLREWDDMGVTPNEIAAALPAVRLFQCIAEDMPVQETFDTIALHNVTEHLIQLDLVFSGLVPLLHDTSRIVFLHHNYYCWNGHHFAPNRPDQIDLSVPGQAQVYDWQHIDIMDDLPDDHYFRTHLNRIRLDEIKAITEKYFDVEIWDEIPSSAATLERLTPEIIERVRKKLPDIQERELTTNVVYCVASKK